MDYSNSPEDITSVVQMVREYRSFINKPMQNAYESRFSNDTTQKSDRISFDSSSIGNLSSMSRKRSSDADYTTLSKEERADIIAARTKVAKLESDLNTSELEKRKLKIKEDSNIKLSSLRLLKRQEECDTTRRKYKQVVDQKETAVAELEESHTKYKELETLYNNELKKWNQEKCKLSATIEEIRASTSTELTNLREKCSRQSTDLFIYKNKLKEAELQMRNFKSRHDETNILCQDYSELKYKCDGAEAKVKTLQEKLVQVSDASFVMQRSQAELSKYRFLEKQNQTLKEENKLFRDGEQNTLILEEKLKNQSLKLEQTESIKERLRKYEFENEEMKRKLEVFGDRPKSQGELTRIISDLQTSSITSSEQNGALEMSLSIMDATLVRKLDELNSLEESTTVLKNKHYQLDDKYSKLQRRLTLITGERDGLRRVLSSYETEDGKAAKVKLEEAESCILQGRKQIEELELELASTRSEMNQQKASSSLLKVQCHQNQSELSIKDAVQLEECKKRLVDLQKEYEKLSDEKENLSIIIQRRELQGDYNPLRTKLLHLKKNPAQLAYESYTKETESIRNENDRLRKTVLKLQQQAIEEDNEEDYSMNVSKLITGSKHMEEAKKELEVEKLKSKKMCEQFAKATKEFREAIYNIFGYCFKATKDGEYKVQSIYSPRPDDFFLFTCSKNNKGETVPGMIETAYAREWMQLFKDYVQDGDSIPAFLSSVTLELFSQITEVRDMPLAQRAKQL